MIPWFIVDVLDFFADRMGYDTNVLCQGGPGWHRGRIGPDRVYFVKRPPGAPRPVRLKV